MESKPGEGSNFRFTLPRLSEAEVVRLEQTGSAAPGSQQPGATFTPKDGPAQPVIPVGVPSAPTVAPPPTVFMPAAKAAVIASPVPALDSVSSPVFAPAPAMRGKDITASRRIR